ncbi:hypothetical protein LG277_09690 [Vreelandella aquamarina]|uniref:hypothetical protein n=1 Tax=Vreelandella aquamarina TaxID=77097 RepID=UPI00384EF6FD
MNTRDNQTSKEPEEDILERRKPETFEISEPHRQPEAQKSPGKLPWALIAVIVGVIAILAVWFFSGAN